MREKNAIIAQLTQKSTSSCFFTYVTYILKNIFFKRCVQDNKKY